MTSHSRWIPALILLTTTGALRAQVEDKAELFKPATIKEANERIARIREQLNKQIVVTTMFELTQQDIGDRNLEDHGHRKEVLEQRSRKRIADDNIAGVHIFICKNPYHVHVTFDTDTEKMLGNWVQWYRDELTRKIEARSRLGIVRDLVGKGRTADDGLLDGIDFIGTRFDWKRPIDQTRWYEGLAIMGGMLGAWVVLGIVSRRLRSKGIGTGLVTGDDSGRSIAVLGGGIGAVCGQWLADRVFVGHAPENPVDPPPAELSLPEPPPDYQET